MSHGVRALRCVGRNTADLDRAIAFHRDALGFRIDAVPAAPPARARWPTLRAPPTRCARLSLGAQCIELTEFPGGKPYPPGSTSSDLWFQHFAIVVRDMHAAHRRALQHGAVPITRGGPQLLPPATGSVTAWKFRDPDGHPLELIGFPSGTGDPAWQATQAPGPALGIDHSAISVADIARSIGFYRLLGLHVAARGVNRGVRQQRLDDLDDVEVDVIAMQGPARTPHLELLGYRRPRGRADPPVDPGAIAADRLVWQAAAIDVLLDALADAGYPDALTADGRADGAFEVLLRDPDGHLLGLRETAPGAS
ncbi:MAG TPA: VOC family protein [Rhodanobacteraceae bacterium]|nr:VOC family protein [Rhodanobacteraceae bacterium]